MKRSLPLLVIGFFFIYLTNDAQTNQQKRHIVEHTNVNQLKTLYNKYLTREILQKQQAKELAKKYHWPLVIEDKGVYMELQLVTREGQPIYFTTYNVSAAISTRTNLLHSGGDLGLNLEGQSMTAHVWDAGIARISHVEYDGPDGTDRYTIGDDTTDLHYHAAHVAGTIISSGVNSNAKGMAPQATVVGYDWSYDTSEAIEAVTNGMIVSNHSYGYHSEQIPDSWFGAYRNDAQEWDEIMYNAPYYLMVVSAGNGGNDSTSNAEPLEGNNHFDKLSGHATAKNNLVVANAKDAIIDNEGHLVSVLINQNSSQGPTDDYRIKPDITGNGTTVYSTFHDSDTNYHALTGTSMASPNVSGSLLLLQQHYANLNNSMMYASTLKGLVLHTADDAGVQGPDVEFGWGLMNAKQAVEAISNNGTKSIVNELILSEGQTYTFSVNADGINALKASICWTDPAGTINTATNSPEPALINDLDLRISNGTTYYPFKLTSLTTNDNGDNTVDPFELITIDDASGEYTITITHKGNLQSGVQRFSLIVTGLSTDVDCNAEVPTDFNLGNVNYNSANIFWNVISGASYDVRYKPVNSSDWTTQSFPITSVMINNLEPETSYEVQIRSICNSGVASAYTESLYFSTVAEPLSFCESSSISSEHEFIGGVTLHTLDNQNNESNTYSDFTDLSTTLTKNETYTILVTPQWPATVYKAGYAVWIDFNDNGDFTDEGEEVWFQYPTKDSQVSGTFTIPQSAENTTVRMRVSMKYNGVPSACEIFNYGEVEDYSIIINEVFLDTEPPSAPLALQADNITEESLDLSWEDSEDNVGVYNYEIYRDAILIGSTDDTSFNVTGLTENTIYRFYVIAVDDAGNSSENSNTIEATTLMPIPDCEAIISSFPYNQGFENGLGLWSQAEDDDFDWTIQSQSTISAYTGPSAAVEGEYYAFMEASTPNYPTKNAVLLSPCIDLIGQTDLSLSFNYHMYGADDMGELKLEASLDNGLTWEPLWTEQGNQGNSWYLAVVAIDQFLGKTVKFRFNGNTGETWQSDIAVDNFKITPNPDEQCIAATLDITFDNYPEETSWNITNSEGTIIFSGGNYDTQPDGSSISIPLCFDAGCYTINVYDSYGDGMCCSYGNGSFVLTQDDTGTVLADGGSFTDSQAIEFCINSGKSNHTRHLSTQAEINTPDETFGLIEDIVIYPNPTSDYFQVKLKDTKMKFYTMVNSFGQIIKEGVFDTNPIDVSDVSPGVYVVNFSSDKKTLSKKLIVR